MNYQESKTKSKNRKIIVDAAFQLFLNKGLAYTTVMDIVEAAKIERKTFYNYFSDKDELLDYTYYLALMEFYKDEFNDDYYNGFNNGYDKTVYYFKTIVRRFRKFIDEMYYTIAYDHYTNKKAHINVVDEIYKELNITPPLEYFVEGVNDGTIVLESNSTEDVFMLINQSIGSFASRKIYRNYKESDKVLDEAFSQVTLLLDMLLNEIKKDIR